MKFFKSSLNKAASPQSQLSKNLELNIKHIKQMFGASKDIISRNFKIGEKGEHEVALLYTDGLTLNLGIQSLMESLMLESNYSEVKPRSLQDFLEIVKDRILNVSEITEADRYDDIYNAMLSGDVIFLMDGIGKAIVIGLRLMQSRGIQEPQKEVVVRGPHQSFTEVIRVNTSLVRRIIKSPHLWMESFKIGRYSQTETAIMYVSGIADEKVIEEVRRRIKLIDIDAILDSSNVEELIQDSTISPFPTVFNTERPDVIAAELMEGKVAIFVDGSPYVLCVPALFVAFIHSAEDYYQRADISSLIRIVRYLAFGISLLLPSIYIAIITFHHEMLPTALLISVAAQRESVPFPAFVEAAAMELTFEILREAGIRMPKHVGPAISIVGTLVLGTAAVEAGIVSASMIIIVATTAIASFVIPTNNIAISFRLLRFPIMGLAAAFGFFGIIISVIIITLHLCSLRSFGVPYMAPFAPFSLQDQKDSIFRMPLWMLRKRPTLLAQANLKRQQHDKQDPPNIAGKETT